MAKQQTNPAQSLGRTDRIQDITTNSTVALKEQSGWTYINPSSGTTASTTITFPTAFTSIRSLEFGVLGAKTSTAPTAVTDTSTSIGGEIILLSSTSASTSGFTLNAYKNPAYSSSSTYYLFWWRAKGVY